MININTMSRGKSQRETGSTNYRISSTSEIVRKQLDANGYADVESQQAEFSNLAYKLTVQQVGNLDICKTEPSDNDTS